MKSQTSSLPKAIGVILVGCLRLWISWLWLAMAGALVVWVMVVPKKLFDVWHAWLWPFYGLFSGFIVAMLLVEHFTSYRWRLVPGYRTDCLAAGGILGLIFLSITGALIVQGSPERLAAAGLTVLAFSLGLWLIVRPWAPIVCIPLPVALLPLSRMADWPGRLAAPAETWAGNACCALAAGFLLAQFIRWIVALDEDYPAFATWRSALVHWRFSFGFAVGGFGKRSSPRWTTVPATPRLDKWSARWQDWWFDRALRTGPQRYGWTARRWSLGALPPAAEILLLWVIAANFLFTWLWGMPVTGTFAISLIQVCGFFLFRLIHFQRRPMLAIESLRPVTRLQLVRQLGAVVLARLSGLMAIMGIVGILAAVWPNPTSSWFPPAGPHFSLTLWPLALAVFFALIGLVAWLRTVGPVALEIGAAIVGGYVFFFLAMLPLAITPDFDAGRIALLVGVIIALLLTGIALLRSAYRRWQSIELG